MLAVQILDQEQCPDRRCDGCDCSPDTYRYVEGVLRRRNQLVSLVTEGHLASDGIDHDQLVAVIDPFMRKTNQIPTGVHCADIPLLRTPVLSENLRIPHLRPSGHVEHGQVGARLQLSLNCHDPRPAEKPSLRAHDKGCPRRALVWIEPCFRFCSRKNGEWFAWCRTLNYRIIQFLDLVPAP